MSYRKIRGIEEQMILFSNKGTQTDESDEENEKERMFESGITIKLTIRDLLELSGKNKWK